MMIVRCQQSGKVSACTFPGLENLIQLAREHGQVGLQQVV